MPSKPGCDVLVVGAGPTGLALAAALTAGGVRVRIVDQSLDAAHESRALAVQPRSLEVLRGFGLADELVSRGNPAARLRIHAGARVVPVRLFDIGLEDTAYPFLLFVSQAETESVLGEHLSASGVRVERGVRLVGFRELAEGGTDAVEATLARGDGTVETVTARYLVGCDGAHSTVREAAGIAFEGGGYPQTFLLADLSADGVEPGSVHAWLGKAGPLFLFPLGSPAPWRLITMREAAPEPVQGATGDVVSTSAVTLAELQAAADRATDWAGGEPVRLQTPVWATAFRLHHRQALRYRAGAVFLAGDAAHIHSPAGAQGMNTGIQDAANLGWKLAMVLRGAAPERLLDSYDAERRPVGAFVLRFTDRAFTAATATGPVVGLVRRHLAPRAIPVLLRFRAGRGAAFRTVSQLGVAYRGSPAVGPEEPATAVSRRRALGSRLRGRVARRGPKAGDRMPDALVTWRGRQCWLQEILQPTAYQLLLVGPVPGWSAGAVAALERRHGERLTVRYLTAEPRTDDHLGDPARAAIHRLGVRGSAHLVVRPDGHLGYRADHGELAGAARYLDRWLTPGN